MPNARAQTGNGELFMMEREQEVDDKLIQKTLIRHTACSAACRQSFGARDERKRSASGPASLSNPRNLGVASVATEEQMNARWDGATDVVQIDPAIAIGISTARKRGGFDRQN